MPRVQPVPEQRGWVVLRRSAPALPGSRRLGRHPRTRRIRCADDRRAQKNFNSHPRWTCIRMVSTSGSGSYVHGTPARRSMLVNTYVRAIAPREEASRRQAAKQATVISQVHRRSVKQAFAPRW